MGNEERKAKAESNDALTPNYFRATTAGSKACGATSGRSTCYTSGNNYDDATHSG